MCSRVPIASTQHAIQSSTPQILYETSEHERKTVFFSKTKDEHKTIEQQL